MFSHFAVTTASTVSKKEGEGMNVFRQSRWLIFLCVGLFSSLPALAVDKVVVIPLFDDAPPLDPLAPLAADSPPNSAYTINTYTGGDTVTDKITGLEWQRQDDDTARNLLDAWDYCKALTLAGKTDWRLPKISELLSIVNYGVQSPAINGSVFPGTNLSPWSYVTANPGVGIPSAGASWVVYSNDGSASPTNVSSASYFAVRCVRGNDIPYPLLKDNGNNTVTDLVTELTWQKQNNDITGALWSAASNYCAALTLGGKTDWRLPTIKELASLVNYEALNPAIDKTRFPETISAEYWSATDRAIYSTSAWAVNFLGGTIAVKLKENNLLSVRCVR